jgi:hypothetical protein
MIVDVERIYDEFDPRDGILMFWDVFREAVDDID